MLHHTSAAASGKTWNNDIQVNYYDPDGAACGWITASQTDGLYIFTNIPDETVQIMFIDLWEGKATAILTIPEGCNMFILDGNTDADGKYTGAWSKYNP